MSIELDVDGLVVYVSSDTPLHLVTEDDDALLAESGSYLARETGAAVSSAGEEATTEDVQPIQTEAGLVLTTETGVVFLSHLTTEDGDRLLDEAGNDISAPLGRFVDIVHLATEDDRALLTEAGDFLSAAVLGSQGLAAGTASANAVGRAIVPAGFAAGQATALGIGKRFSVGVGAAAGTAVPAGRSFFGFAGFAGGIASVLGVGVSTTGGFVSHVELIVDGVDVFETGSGIAHAGAAAGRATVTGVGSSIRSGAGHAIGTATVHAQGLIPNQGIGRANGIAVANAQVFASSVGLSFGAARVGSPLDELEELPLTSRGMTALLAAAIQLPVVRPIFLYEGQFKDGELNLWTGIGDLSWNGKIWTGAGGLLNISSVEETDQQQAQGVVVQLSAVPTSGIALALASVQRNMPGQIWLGLIDDANRVVENPQTMFRGRLDTVTIEDDANAAVIKASYENEMITLEHAREIRYTDEEQKRLYPEDRGLEFVASIQDLTLRWGSRG